MKLFPTQRPQNQIELFPSHCAECEIGSQKDMENNISKGR